jgi:hypothetical protein
MQPLKLLAGEKKSFDVLTPGLKEGWTVESENKECYEQPEDLAMRYRITELDHPACLEILEKIRDAKDSKDIERIAVSIDVLALPSQELRKLFFVLGSRVLSGMIGYLLSNVAGDDDLAAIVGLTQIRHSLFLANSAAAAIK